MSETLYRKITQGKRVRYEPIALIHCNNPNAVLTDNHKTFYLSLALGILETVKDQEEAKSARFNKIYNLIERVSSAIEIYQPDSWDNVDIHKAVLTLNKIDEFIHALYSEAPHAQA